MNLNSVLKQLRKLRVIPVVRTSTPELAEKAIDWLTDAGFRTIEITLTIPKAFDLISKFDSRKDILIGAGTVTSIEMAERCLESGAKFIVSPCIVKELPGITHKKGVPCFLGAMTPTEVQSAVIEGADAVKIFPIKQLGGVSYLKALSSVFPHVKLIPTGGIKPNDFFKYIENGAMCVGLGGELLNEKLIMDDQRETIVQLGKQILQKTSCI
jgi:2-dehydro-3-deoxyphosphogluconate aldolase/(4S)-4-hydroxy-2-oxoglutarate aldolase